MSGEYAEWYVKGMEQSPEDPYHIQASACCKHYVANSMDGTTAKNGEHHDRNHVDSTITMQDLVDSYMLPSVDVLLTSRASSNSLYTT